MTKVPSVAWQRPGEGLLVGYEAERAAKEEPEHLLVGWMDRLFSFRLLGGIEDPDLGFTAAGVLALLVESPIREAIHGLGVDPAQIDLVTFGLVVPHRWSALQQDAAARVLNQVVEDVCPAAVIGMVRIADVEALGSILGTEHDDGTLILDVGSEGVGHGGAVQGATDADIITTTASALAIQEDGGARVSRILLVGGGALDPGLRRTLEQEFSRDTRAVVDPELAAVMGGLEVLEQAAPGRVALVPPEASPAPVAAQDRRAPVALLVGGGLTAAAVAAVALYLSGALSGDTPATVPERPWITTPALPVQPPEVDQQTATRQALDSATSSPTSAQDPSTSETTGVAEDASVAPNESAPPVDLLLPPAAPAPVPALPTPPLTNPPLPTGSPPLPAPSPTGPAPTTPAPTPPS
ncbi:MAG: hypothetical protein Q4P07_14080, partial [Ornithinimicrobium sp.]|nr:hypothetical protein [Ornithinimicrobium sp.]